MEKVFPAVRERANVLFFSTYVSCESGASYAMREAMRNVAASGIRPLVVIPDSADSRDMFRTSEFDVAYLKIERPRRVRSVWTHGRWAVNSVATFLSLRRLIRQRNVDLVHCNEITDLLAGMAAKSCGIPCICHVRTDRPPRPYRELLLSTLRHLAGAIIVTSKATAAWVIADGKDLAQRTLLIWDCAFEMHAYDSPACGAPFRKELGIQPDEILVLLVSKLVTPKGHENFIRAAEKVRQASKRFRFVIVGGPVPGHEEEAAAIHHLAEQLTPAPSLQFVGPRPDLPAIYAASDIVVHCPIYPDPYPTVVLLAMAAGKPVIGSRIGGIPEQINHDRTGVMVPPHNADALAQAIIELSRDPAKRESLASAGRRWVRENFTPETQGRTLAGLYAHVLSTSLAKKNRGAHSAGSAEALLEARDHIDA